MSSSLQVWERFSPPIQGHDKKNLARSFIVCGFENHYFEVMLKVVIFGNSKGWVFLTLGTYSNKIKDFCEGSLSHKKLRRFEKLFLKNYPKANGYAHMNMHQYWVEIQRNELCNFTFFFTSPYWSKKYWNYYTLDITELSRPQTSLFLP